ncbi:hypothetical protein X976_5319 [Burkholderia pseudomallei MSHR7500]|nr:hypothetical protein X962_3061 [Burkholderia pseudomallei MSHR7343]KGS88934.1 hypothetical protein X976_5319 [Burkholderia pseudomallei MSHR7500]
MRQSARSRGDTGSGALMGGGPLRFAASHS